MSDCPAQPLRDTLRREGRAEARAWRAALILIVIYWGLRGLVWGFSCLMN